METDYRPRNEDYEEWEAENTRPPQSDRTDEDTYGPHGQEFNLNQEPPVSPPIGLPAGTFVPPNSR